MGKETDIQWCDSTVNASTGCDGCELWHVTNKGPCYAGNYHETRMAKALPSLYAPDFTEVRLAPGRMAKAAAWSDLTDTKRPRKPWLDGMPRTIFVDDMGDLFSRAVPFEYIRDEVIEVARSPKGRRHILMLLTKQPSRMAEFAAWLETAGIEWPANVWAGTSVTSERTVRRVEFLLYVPAAVRFVSFEPLLGPVHPTPSPLHGISLAIIGGESDQKQYKGRKFDVDWARSLIGQCRTAGVSVFMKQLGSHWARNAQASAMIEWEAKLDSDAPEWAGLRPEIDPKGGDWDEWPADLRIREMPRVAVASL